MGKTFPMPAGMRGDAVFSKEQGIPHFRHVLRRWWPPLNGKDHKKLMVIGHNPSGAGKYQNDPTISKVCKFALAWGYNDVLMHNILDRIADDPADLLRVPAGSKYGVQSKHNLLHLLQAASSVDRIVCAWGSVAPLFKVVADGVEAALRAQGFDLYAIDFNADGSPKHPLYIEDGTPLKPWGDVD